MTAHEYEVKYLEQDRIKVEIKVLSRSQLLSEMHQHKVVGYSIKRKEVKKLI